VLSDRHLEGIAARLPTTRTELANCPGIGPARLETYGADILDVIASAP
jgi:DNA helicase-2/ATP-dependent DNA helicase PcrA